MTLRMTRRWAIAIATAAGSATVLAGCVGGASGSESAGEDGPQTVTWWAWNAIQPDDTIARFEAAHPDISVDFKLYSYGDYVTAIRTGLTSADGPDVFQLQPGELVTNLGPLALPLDDDVAAQGGADKINPEGLAQLQLDGRQIALPSYMSGAGLVYYNASILDELGLSMPKDFEEWKSACAAITAAGYECLAHGAKDAWVNTDVYLSLINSIEPGAVYDAIDGKTNWTGDGFVRAMQAWSDLFTSGIISPGATAAAEYPDAFAKFLSKKAAFIALGTWNTPGTMTKAGIAVSQATVSEPIDSVYLSAPFPAPLAGGQPTGMFGGPDNGWAISAKSDTPNAARTFLDFLALGEGQEIQAANANFPAVVDVSVSTDDVVDPRQVVDIERQQSGLQGLIGARQIPYADLSTALGDALSAVAAGTTSPADAMAQVQAVSDSLSR